MENKIKLEFFNRTKKNKGKPKRSLKNISQEIIVTL